MIGRSPLWPRTLIVFGVFAVGGLATFVWPTRFRMGTTSWESELLLTRTNRLTGRTDILVGNVWIETLEPSDDDVGQSGAILGDVPRRELGAVTGTASIGLGTMVLQLYNGSSWTINSIVIRLEQYGEGEGCLSSRLYQTPVYPSLSPRQAGTYRVAVVEDPGQRRFEWLLEAARGLTSPASGIGQAEPIPDELNPDKSISSCGRSIFK